MRSFRAWIVFAGIIVTAVKVQWMPIPSVGTEPVRGSWCAFSSASGVAVGPHASTAQARTGAAPLADSRGPAMAELEPDLAGGGQSWLAELDKWREMAGVPPAAANSALSRGSERHARYLVNQGPPDISAFRSYDRTIGPGAHIENARARWYTAEGAEAAQGGRLTADVIQCADVAWEGRDEKADIDQLLIAPFHRLSLVAPWGVVAGYGSYGEYPRRVAALALRGPVERAADAVAVEFPPDGSEMPWGAMVGSEWPNPLAACAGYAAPAGVPITVQDGGRLDLASYSLRDESEGREVEACAFDAKAYHDSDPVQRRRGRELLADYGAIVMIPRHPLREGHRYRAEIQARQHDFAWSFAVGPLQPPAAHPIIVRGAIAAPAQKQDAKLSAR